MATVSKSPAIGGVVIVEPKIWGRRSAACSRETFHREWLPGDARQMVRKATVPTAARELDSRAAPISLHQADYWYVPFGSVNAGLYTICDARPDAGEERHS